MGVQGMLDLNEGYIGCARPIPVKSEVPGDYGHVIMTVIRSKSLVKC